MPFSKAASTSSGLAVSCTKIDEESFWKFTTTSEVVENKGTHRCAPNDPPIDKHCRLSIGPFKGRNIDGGKGTCTKAKLSQIVREALIKRERKALTNIARARDEEGFDG